MIGVSGSYVIGGQVFCFSCSFCFLFLFAYKHRLFVLLVDIGYTIMHITFCLISCFYCFRHSTALSLLLQVSTCRLITPTASI